MARCGLPAPSSPGPPKRVRGAGKALALLLCHAAVCGAADARRDSRDNTRFVSRAVQYCYEKLTQSSWCCLDAHVPRGVSQQTISRPGTAWYCSDKIPKCLDAGWGGLGERGDDILWQPHGADCSTPRMLYLHGGSWVYDSPTRDGYLSLGAKLAALTGAIVMVIDYPLVPVGNYSAIMDASLEALIWLSSHGPMGRHCEGRPPPLFVGGDSAGGGTAFSVVIQANKEPGRWPALSGAVLYSPWTNLECDTPTYYYNAYGGAQRGGGFIYTGDVMFKSAPETSRTQYRGTAIQYVSGNESMLFDPVASPFFAGAPELEGLPPLYWVVSGTELLTGDSVIPATRARELGVEVVLDVYDGMWHVFPMYSEGCGGNETIYQAELALNRTGEFVRALSARASHVSSAVSSMMGSSSADSREGLLYTAFHYGMESREDRAEPWVPVAPLSALQYALPTSGPGAEAPRPPEPQPPVSSGGGWGTTFAMGAFCGALAGIIGRELLPMCCPCLRRLSLERKPFAAERESPGHDLPARIGASAC